MEIHRHHHFDKRAVLGSIFIIIGIVFLSENLGWFDNRISDIIISWPMLLVVLGFFSLLRKRNNAGGWVMIAIGVYFILPKIIPMPYDHDRLFWPILLVMLGFFFIFKKKRHPSCNHFDCFSNEEYSADLIDEVNVFGGGEKKITTQTFKGGKITSIFGGSNYDMLDCELAEGKNVLDMVNIFGGSKLVVPNNWKIHVEVVSIFGGFADKRRNVNITPESSTKELIITGVAIFGGGEIKSL
jgi:predicted membrane protein